MCGLAGELRFDGTAADVATLQRMTGCLEHRGPDGSGAWARGPVALGHRRLSIIDLSVNGAQPMVDPHLGLTVVFNGIIYNHQQLRARLAPLALTRVAPPGSLIVNSSRGGGAKDTWIGTDGDL